MTEWYIYYEQDQPREVLLGRRHALNRLLQGISLDGPTHRKFQLLLEAGAPSLGEPIRFRDRHILRVIGPGTEV